MTGVLLIGLLSPSSSRAAAQDACTSSKDMRTLGSAAKTEEEVKAYYAEATKQRDCWVRKVKSGEKNLQQAFLYEADFKQADLSGANLSEAYLREADLTEANLYQANLTGAMLGGAKFEKADLSSANVDKANVKGAIVSQATLGVAFFAWKKFYGGLIER